MTLSTAQSRELIRESLAKVGSNPSGLRVLAWVIYTLSMLEDGAPVADPHQILIHEGRRSVGRMVLNELRQLDAELGSDLDRAVHEIRYSAPVPPARQEKKP